jgi:hypothetical protein
MENEGYYHEIERHAAAMASHPVDKSSREHHDIDVP